MIFFNEMDDNWGSSIFLTANSGGWANYKQTASSTATQQIKIYTTDRWDYSGTDTSCYTSGEDDWGATSFRRKTASISITGDIAYNSNLWFADNSVTCAGSWQYVPTSLTQPNWGSPHVWTVNNEYSKKRAAAKERARGLLVSHLTPGQQEEYIEHGYFHVITPKKHRYRITQGQISNVIRLNKKGKPMRAFCIHPVGCLPDEDAMLAQKLMLENDEEAFLRIANHRKVRMRARLEPWHPRNRAVA